MSSKKTAAARFTAGDYFRPPSAQDPLYYYGEAPRYAWVRVLKAIEEVAPAVVETLAREVFPDYERAAGRLTVFPVTDPRTLEALTQQPGCRPELHALRAALERWAAKWHLHERGLLVRALETLLYWHHHPAQESKREWVIQGPEAPCPYPHVADIHLVAKGWHPQTEPRQEAERRILAELQRQVRDHLNRVEAVAKEQHGFVKSPIKMQAEHFTWFVRYQVLGESLAMVATTAQTDPPTVKRAVDNIGCLLSGPHWPTWKRPRGKSGPRPAGS
jgi:hypothetical protein